MKIHVICAAYQRVVRFSTLISLRMLINNFLIQTNPNWELHIIHDGPVTDAMRTMLDFHAGEDPRIHWEFSSKRNGNFGHPNRKIMLEKIEVNPDDYILMTNDDNQYTPVFVEYFLGKCHPGIEIGMIYCDTVHSYMGYDVLVTRIKTQFIDMGSFVVRADVAKHIGFNYTHEMADGTYAEACAAECIKRELKFVHISKPLFIHN